MVADRGPDVMRMADAGTDTRRPVGGTVAVAVIGATKLNEWRSVAVLTDR